MGKGTRGLTGLHLLVMLACLWGVLEAIGGVYLRGTCARLFSGSVLMAGAFFFMASAYVTRGRLLPLLLLPVVAAALRIYAAVLTGTPLLAMAVANPIYAFFTETLALLAVLALAQERLKGTIKGRMAIGALSATAGATVFPAVKYFTGISACVLPGTSLPLAIYGLPVAAALSALTVPAGFAFGTWLTQVAAGSPQGTSGLSWKVSTLISALCIVVIAAVYV